MKYQRPHKNINIKKNVCSSVNVSFASVIQGSINRAQRVEKIVSSSMLDHMVILCFSFHCGCISLHSQQQNTVVQFLHIFVNISFLFLLLQSF